MGKVKKMQMEQEMDDMKLDLETVLDGAAKSINKKKPVKSTKKTNIVVHEAKPTMEELMKETTIQR